MRLMLWLSFVISVYCISNTSFAQSGQIPYTVSINPASATIRIGDDVVLRVILTNISHAPVLYGSLDLRHGEFNYDVKVITADGTIPPRTEFGKDPIRSKLPSGRSIRREYTTLNPGDEVHQSIVLNSLYDMTRPGSYIVRVSKKLNNLGDANLVSNAVTVTMVP